MIVGYAMLAAVPAVLARDDINGETLRTDRYPRRRLANRMQVREPGHPSRLGTNMFAGHVGVGLALGRAERRLNVGFFIAAALLLDMLLWLFILAGWESVTIPADFGSTHQADFTFPYSHGLLAAAIWSIVAALLAWLMLARGMPRRSSIGLLIAAAVFSHWVLDALVHRPEMPLAGAASARVGLGLWDRMPIALAIEIALVVLGLALFLRGSRVPRGRSVALCILTLAILAFTLIGMTIAPAPPSAKAMAASSLITLLVLGALYLWLGRAPRTEPGALR